MGLPEKRPRVRPKRKLMEGMWVVDVKDEEDAEDRMELVDFLWQTLKGPTKRYKR